MKNILYVQVMGRQYAVEANPGEELYVNRLAQYVEECMTKIKGESKTVDTMNLAVTAAMNLADELFQLQDGRGTLGHSLETKADELLVMLDNALVTPDSSN
jgi:cell division protein ZapA (FtsZ GTPase activity inhibitor)